MIYYFYFDNNIWFGLKEYNTIIAGAGPAGLFTAVNINNGSVLVLEKMSSPGNKLLIAGSGKCNLTNAGKIDDFFSHYGKNYRFLKHALLEYNNIELIKFINERGLKTFTDKNNKVFPQTEKASDILNLLLIECRKLNVVVKCNSSVISVKYNENYFIVTTNNESYKCKNLVVTTGGKSYPVTGSDGDGYILAQSLGHLIVSPKPALAPVYIDSYSMKELAGVSLKQRIIHLYRNNKKIAEHIGDIGFTHRGISGPGILDFSRFMQNGDLLKINLINENPDILKNNILQLTECKGSVTVQALFRDYEIPLSLIKIILKELEISSLEKLSHLSVSKRNILIASFTSYPFLISKIGDFNTAMVTAGGVSLNEISSKTMESKLINGLYFAGEVMDIDGDTGGYNIQAAFSTGNIVAKSINKEIL